VRKEIQVVGEQNRAAAKPVAGEGLELIAKKFKKNLKNEEVTPISGM
jgi:hypothetical protein